MAKQKISYDKTVMYKIVCNDVKIKNVYVGCTTDFIRRKSEHKQYSKYPHTLLYNCISNNGGWSNWSMIEIEKYPCSDGYEAKARERYWVEKLNCDLNMYKPILTEDKKGLYKTRVELRKEHITTTQDKINEWFNNNYEVTNDIKDANKLKLLFKLFEDEQDLKFKLFFNYNIFYETLKNHVINDRHKTRHILCCKKS